jgi:hypothetical protein
MSFLRRHGLGLTLAGMFLTFTAVTLVTGWFEFASEQRVHGQPVTVGDFWLWWVFEYSMSLVADIFGALILVMLTKRLFEIGSAESD